jgi:hypothetical protein
MHLRLDEQIPKPDRINLAIGNLKNKLSDIMCAVRPGKSCEKFEPSVPRFPNAPYTKRPFQMKTKKN